MVVATGLSTPDVPAFKGVEHLVTYDKMSVNPDDFKDQSILIIGKVRGLVARKIS